MRSDEKPLQVESSSPGRFRAGANRSYPEGIRLLLCISTDGRLWRSPEGGQPNERRRKAGQSERPNREGHAVWAGSVKTFREVGDVKNDTADLWTKGNLRVKRRDPWPRANALPKAAADPELSGQDADKKTQTCLDLVRKSVAQPSAQAS
jgi:hypothetical protein